MLCEHIKEDADQQKHDELKENDDAAGEQGAAAVAFVFCGQQALDDDLVGAVGGHGEKGAAD